MTEFLQVPVHVHRYPPQPLPEAISNDLLANPNTDQVATRDNHSRITADAVSLVAADESFLSAVGGADPLTQSPVLPASTPFSTGSPEPELEPETPVNDSDSRGARIPHSPVRMIASMADNHNTKLAAQKLLFSFCVVVTIASTAFISLYSAPQTLYGLQEMPAVLRCGIMPVLVWTALVSPVDCAVPWEGARVVSEWSSQGLKESRPWLYKMMGGSTIVPADAALDPYLPHWSFLGQTGHIALELHRNAAITTIIIESDFPNSIPHKIRIWTFVPKPERGPRHSQSPVTPPFSYLSGDRGLSPLLLGDVVFQVGSTAREHRYHVPRRCHAYTPVRVVMLEFLSNGGDGITQIRRIRILGVPS